MTTMDDENLEMLCDISVVLRAHNKLRGGIAPEDAIERIRNIVTLKGEWIKQDNGYIMCPFCKTDTKHGAWWEYCPKCGAKLER